MKIEIDTKQDSPEEIKKVIKMLQHLVGEHAYTNQPNIFEDPTSFGTNSSGTQNEPSSSEPASAFANMFGNIETKEPAKETTNTQEETSSEEADKTKEDVPEVIPY